MIVVDASAWVRALVDTQRPGDESRKALAVDDRWVAPSHMATEVLRTLWRYEFGRLIDPATSSALARLVSTASVEYVSPEPWLLAEQWQLRHNVSSYDATYVAVARRFSAPLLTADGRLARAARTSGVEVRLVPAV